MLAQNYVGLRKALEQTVVDHRLCALSRFFRGLEDRHQRTAPRAPRLCHKLAGAREPSDMHVMAAHVRDGNRIAFSIGRSRVAGVRQTRHLLDRQRVHVGAQHDCRTLAIPEQAYNAGFSDPGRYFIAGGTELVGRKARRARLLHRKFGVRVHVFVKSL